MSVVQYKCPNCGGNIEFNSTNHKFECAFCMSSYSEKEIKDIYPELENDALDEDVPEENETAEQSEFADNTALFSCPNCGAEIISESNTSATSCYYCHTPVILKGRLSGKYRPAKIIPFNHDRPSAVAAFKEWVGKKWFVPNGFKSEKQIENLTGLYLPYWLADCNLNIKSSALAKNITTWRSGDTQYTNTKEYSVRRAMKLELDKIPADASSKTADSLTEAIEPFDYSEIKDFSMSYLSGYLSEKYDVETNVVLPRIESRSVETARNMVRDSIKGYTEVNIVDDEIQFTKMDWTYALLPIWLVTYKYREKYYFFAMNGQTGKVSGIPPLSLPKLAILGAIAAVVGFALALVIGALMI